MELDYRQLERRREHRGFDHPHGLAADTAADFGLHLLRELQAAPGQQADQGQQDNQLEDVPEHQAASASTVAPAISTMRRAKRLPWATISPLAMTLPFTETSRSSSVRRSSATTLSSVSASTSFSFMSVRPSSTDRRTSTSLRKSKPRGWMVMLVFPLDQNAWVIWMATRSSTDPMAP